MGFPVNHGRTIGGAVGSVLVHVLAVGGLLIAPLAGETETPLPVVDFPDAFGVSFPVSSGRGCWDDALWGSFSTDRVRVGIWLPPPSERRPGARWRVPPGVVRVRCLVGRDGTVYDAVVVGGHPCWPDGGNLSRFTARRREGESLRTLVPPAADYQEVLVHCERRQKPTEQTTSAGV